VDCAVINDHLGTRKYLSDEKRAGFKVCNHKGFIPIYSAASRGHLAILKHLIYEKTGDFTVVGNSGFTRVFC